MKNRGRRQMVVLMVGFVLIMVMCTPVAGYAQEKIKYPLKPITIIEPWGAQSWGFLQAQELAAALEPLLGQRVIVQAKSGGASAVGTKIVKESRPDGYTLLHAWIAGFVMVPLQEANPGYDVFKDFDFLAYFTESPVVAISRTDKPWKTLAEYVNYVRANPGKSYAFSGGPALSIHSLCGGEVFHNAGVKVKGIFYDDAAAAGAAMLGGDTDVAMDSFGTLRRYGDQVRAVGVFGEHRYPGFENIPTIAEQGLKAPTVRSWSGIVAPKGLPEEVRNKLIQALKQVLTNSDFQAKILKNLQWFVIYKDPQGMIDMVKTSLEQMKGPIERMKERQKQK
mgnify:CR=1 FL=1